VKSKYEKDRICKRVERLVVDGNEFLQFHGAAITCSLGINGLSTICKKKCCQVCSIIASGFDTEDRTISSSTTVGRHMRRLPRNVLGKESARKAIVVNGLYSGILKTSWYLQESSLHPAVISSLLEGSVLKSSQLLILQPALSNDSNQRTTQESTMS
ncbi:unnamed protein product, partial [Prunus brigantina]